MRVKVFWIMLGIVLCALGSVGLALAQEPANPPVYIPVVIGPAPATPTPTPSPLPENFAPLFTPTPVIDFDSFEDDSGQVSYAGTWSQQGNSSASGGSYHLSSSEQSTVTVTFTGDNITLLRKMDPEGGDASVMIDGRNHGTISFNFDLERWRVPALFDQLAAGSHVMTLTQASAGKNIYIDAFRVAKQDPTTDSQWAAVNRVNYHRQYAGLPLMLSTQALHLAAQKHTEYLYNQRFNPRHAGLLSHQEFADLPGYIGASGGRRASYFGYGGFAGEVLSGGNIIGCIDSLMAAPFHRNTILSYGARHLGFGAKQDPIGSGTCAMLFGVPYYDNIWPDERIIYTYPGNGQVGVPRLWNAYELPEPLPGVQRPVGYPLSLYIAQTAIQQRQPLDASASDWELTAAELANSNGEQIPHYLLHYGTDPRFAPDNVFMIPRAPLLPNQTYTVYVAGIDSHGVAFDHRWSFTTEATHQYSCNTVPVLVYPPDGTETDTLRRYFRWYLDRNPLISEFHLEVATEPSFGALENSLRAIGPRLGEWHFDFSPSLLFRPEYSFAPGTTYYWRAYVQCGEERGPYSAAARFTTGKEGVKLPAPTIVSPNSGAVLTGTSVYIEWTPVPGALEYFVEFSGSPDVRRYSYWVTETSSTNGYLQPNAAYSLTVSAVNEYAYGQNALITIQTGAEEQFTREHEIAPRVITTRSGVSFTTSVQSP